MTSRKKKDYTKLLSITVCNICHLELSDPRRIECGHIFCLHCLGTHLRYTSSCPTCKRPMEPELGKVENYPVATEIVHLLQSLQKVASCSHIVDEEVEDDDKIGDEGQYEDVDPDPNQLPPQPKAVVSNELCDIHGQKLVSVCVTCDDELICAKCSMHSTHDKLEISEHTKHLERLLDKQRTDLIQREKDDEAEEEKLQDMIETQVEQKETIKDEIEDIAEGLFAQIHMKKEKMLQPIEKKADEYVKQLTARQEHIKDRKSEFHHISSKIGSFQNDDTTDYCRKAKRFLKQANIALRVENKPLPQYQTIEFIRNETVIEDLLKLQLGEVSIEEVSIAQDEEYNTSDYIIDFEDIYQEDGYDDWKAMAFTPPPPRPVIPKPDKTSNPKVKSEDNIPPLPHSLIPRRPLPLPSYKQVEKLYADLDDTLYENTLQRLKHDNHDKKPLEDVDDNQARHYNPSPPLSPFSGTFRKSVSLAIDNRAFPQRLCHRVFLPFRPCGFTVVNGSLGSYYTFVTEDGHVEIIKQNGDLYKTITDLVQPFDVASQQRGESLAPLYITDEGRRIGDGSIRVYTSEGEFLKVLVGKLRKPQGISLSRVGLVYVCDEASILVICPKTGKKKRIISTIGKDPIFVRPMYVMVSATGKLLVSDVGTRELKIHDETRKYTDKFKPDENEVAIYTSFTPGMCSEDSSSNYYVIDQERNLLYMLRGGGRSEKLELPQKPKGHDGIPTAVSFDTDTGNIVVF